LSGVEDNQSRPCAACVMTSATASGCESMMTWLESTVVVSAWIVCAIMASSSGEMTRSSLAIMYQDGFVCQAGAVRASRGSFDRRGNLFWKCDQGVVAALDYCRRGLDPVREKLLGAGIEDKILVGYDKP